ncbi:MAG TPA: nitroreductase/quinone reductase family protein [Solirubrobacterales bacterium]|jgi:deazaflavin-dependent oxidoreductase (nitroreductase family)|nr:nitroreductase/quinone reductase family protein [Solirubrobacterales bacterium]
MTEATSAVGTRRDEDGGAKAEDVRAMATKATSKHGRLMSSARDGRVLSALMLPFFMVRPPSGYGVLTTTGRRTGKTRRKCIRVIRQGNKAYLVSLRLPGQAERSPSAVAAWVWNIRSEPSVRLRIRGGTFAGVARELSEPAELEQARRALYETVNLFDYGECSLHLRGLPAREKIRELHGYWFDTGVPLAIELRDWR